MEPCFYGFAGYFVQGAGGDGAADCPGWVGFFCGGNEGLAVGALVLLHGVAGGQAVIFLDLAVHVVVDIGAAGGVAV